jgi:hypothetical protein
MAKIVIWKLSHSTFNNCHGLSRSPNLIAFFHLFLPSAMKEDVAWWIPSVRAKYLEAGMTNDLFVKPKTSSKAGLGVHNSRSYRVSYLRGSV